MTGYELTRTWFDWAFENPDLNTPTHTATYMWIIEKWNRSGHAKKIVLPSSESMTAIGVKSYNTYIKVLNELIEFGFIEMIQKSKNQFTANIVAISNFNKALDKALDKAMIKHSTKQSESTDESIDSIYKQDNKETIEQDNKEIKEISKEILERDLENEKLRLEIERLNQALEEKKKKDSTKGGAAKAKKVSWLDLKEMELPEIYNEEEFRETWQSWCEFKQSRKESVLTDKGLELWFKKLETLSSRDLSISIQIVNESIANNWQGIFELKNQKSNATNKPNSQKHATPYGAVGGVNAQGRGMFFAPIYDTAESSTSNDRHEVEGFYQSEL